MGRAAHPARREPGADRSRAASAGADRIDRPDATALAPTGDESYRKADFADLVKVLDEVVVLDVRRDDERAGSHLPGSAHVPLHRLLSELDTLPPGELWVHCVSGYRSAIAASLLRRAGREVVWIADDYANAVAMGVASPPE